MLNLLLKLVAVLGMMMVWLTKRIENERHKLVEKWWGRLRSYSLLGLIGAIPLTNGMPNRAESSHNLTHSFSAKHWMTVRWHWSLRWTNNGMEPSGMARQTMNRLFVRFRGEALKMWAQLCRFRIIAVVVISSLCCWCGSFKIIFYSLKALWFNSVARDHLQL